MSSLTQLIKTRFAHRRIAVIGDVVADQFLHGTISRVSREAPVFILDHEDTDTRPGGAANAAANVASLGARPILAGFVGNDVNGDLLKQTLVASNVTCDNLVFDDRLGTTTKVRVLAGQHYAPRQQVIRIDYSHKAAIPEELYAQLREKVADACSRAEAIIVSDYGYGAAEAPIVEFAHGIANESGIPLLVDSRFRLSLFPGATAATPNQEEVENIIKQDLTPDACEALRERLSHQALLVTRGNKGMMLFERGKPPVEFDAVGSKEPVDVTGAGDTVIGAFALGIASGLSFSDAANVANHAGGIVVMKRGTATVTIAELLASLESHTEGASHATQIG